MGKLNKQDIIFLAEHSNIDQNNIATLLKEDIYPSPQMFQKHLRLSSGIFGIGFIVIGILFFFAFNWENLPNYLKFGIIQGLIIGSSLWVVFKRSSFLKNELLLAIFVLVGVLFAVFGQVYQTGANAYDFFFSWTIGISLLAWTSKCSLHWLFYIIILNTTIILYFKQILNLDYFTALTSLLFILNGGFLLLTIQIKSFRSALTIPNYFRNSIALIWLITGTIGFIIGLFQDHTWSFYYLIALISGSYILLFIYAIRTKSLFFFTSIPLSFTIMLSTYLFYLYEKIETFYIIFFLILTCSFLVLKFSKKLKHGNHES